MVPAWFDHAFRAVLVVLNVVLMAYVPCWCGTH